MGLKTYQVTSEANTTAMSAVVIVSRIDGGLPRRISAAQLGNAFRPLNEGSIGASDHVVARLAGWVSHENWSLQKNAF